MGLLEKWPFPRWVSFQPFSTLMSDCERKNFVSFFSTVYVHIWHHLYQHIGQDVNEQCSFCNVYWPTQQTSPQFSHCCPTLPHGKPAQSGTWSDTVWSLWFGGKWAGSSLDSVCAALSPSMVYGTPGENEEENCNHRLMGISIFGQSLLQNLEPE